MCSSRRQHGFMLGPSVTKQSARVRSGAAALGGASDVVQLDGAGRRMCALSRAGTVTCFDAFRGEKEFKGAPVLAVESARP